MVREGESKNMCVERRQRGGKTRQHNTRQGKARQGKARQGKARQGKARQGKTEKLPPSPSFHLAILHYPSLSNNLVSPNIINTLQNILICKQIDRQTDGQL